MAEQLFQIGIKALIRNSRGQILMLHLPAWGGNPAHWDLPGGRVDGDESFIDTLKRELKEEIGLEYTGEPTQLAAFRTKITIPVGDQRIPLVFVVYEVDVVDDIAISLDPESNEDGCDWFNPNEAAEHMTIKFPKDFCVLVRSLETISN